MIARVLSWAAALVFIAAALFVAANGLLVGLMAFDEHPDGKPSTYLIFATMSLLLTCGLGWLGYRLVRSARR